MSELSNLTDKGKAPVKSRKDGHRTLKPDKGSPAEAEKQVRSIAKMRYSDHDKVAVALAPVFGLGSDLVSGQRAQGLFKHRPFLELFSEFAEVLLEGRWDVPVADWAEVTKAVPKHDGPRLSEWPNPKEGERGVIEYYAHFLSRSMHEIRHPTKSTQLVYWIKEADLDDGYWVLFHALMYLQLEVMREYRRHAPLKDRINHVLGR